MSKSPGHRKWPEHRVCELPVMERMMVKIGDETIADSADVIRVNEDHHPVRYYFPRVDVRMEKLESTTTMTACPFKGEAIHFTIRARTGDVIDAAWSYEDPYDEHNRLKDRLAFYGDKLPGISIRPRI